MRGTGWHSIATPGVAVGLMAANADAVETRLGQPDLYSATAQIARPHSSAFDLSVDPAGWPGLIVRDQRTELGRDANGTIPLISTCQVSGSARNQAIVWANDAGTLGGQSRMESLTGTQTCCGTFTQSGIS